MKLEEIYLALKDSDGSGFYVPAETEDLSFIYLEDAQLSITKISEEKVFGYNYFFNENDKSKKLEDKYDELIRDLCKLKDYPETYDNIRNEVWAIKYNEQTVCTIHCINIYNPSSLHIALPPSLETFDYIMDICKIFNNYYNGTETLFGEIMILERSNIKQSTFKDFLHYCK